VSNRLIRTSAAGLFARCGHVLLHKCGLGLVDKVLLVLILLVEVVARMCGTDGGLMCDSVEDAEDQGAEAQDLYVEVYF